MWPRLTPPTQMLAWDFSARIHPGYGLTARETDPFHFDACIFLELFENQPKAVGSKRVGVGSNLCWALAAVENMSTRARINTAILFMFYQLSFICIIRI